MLRLALRHSLNQNEHAPRPGPVGKQALGWLERASLPISALDDPAVISELLDVLSRKLDGTPAASDYFSRRRVMHRVFSYAVRKKRLRGNPLGKARLPEGWSAPPGPEDLVDPRSVGGPDLVADMLAVTSYIGRRQGARFVAFYGCMFYAMMRPSEVIALTRDGCHLPAEGWGRLIFADTSPAAGKDFTDDGRVHESRGLKGRPRQATARRATRNVPIPPELVAMLAAHVEHFGVAEDGRLFRSENGNPIQPSTYRQVWTRTRALALTPAQLATPLMRRGRLQRCQEPHRRRGGPQPPPRSSRAHRPVRPVHPEHRDHLVPPRRAPPRHRPRPPRPGPLVHHRDLPRLYRHDHQAQAGADRLTISPRGTRPAHPRRNPRRPSGLGTRRDMTAKSREDPK